MISIGRVLLLVGVLLVVTGAVMLLLGRMNLPFGRLRGDLVWRGRNLTVSFPLMTCLLVSAVLSLLLWIGNRLGR